MASLRGRRERVTTSAASKGSAHQRAGHGRQVGADELVGVPHPVERRRARSGWRRATRPTASSRTRPSPTRGARVGPRPRSRRRERAVRDHLAEVRRRCQVGDLQGGRHPRHGEVGVAAEHRDHPALVAHRDRLRRSGTSRCQRGSSSRQIAALDDGAPQLRVLRGRDAVPTTSSGCAVGAGRGPAWATHRNVAVAGRAAASAPSSAERDPEQEVGERQVREQLPLGDHPLQVLDRAAGQLGVLGEQLAQRGHFTASPAPVVTIQPRGTMRSDAAEGGRTCRSEPARGATGTRRAPTTARSPTPEPSPLRAPGRHLCPACVCSDPPLDARGAHLDRGVGAAVGVLATVTCACSQHRRRGSARAASSRRRAVTAALARPAASSASPRGRTRPGTARTRRGGGRSSARRSSSHSLSSNSHTSASTSEQSVSWGSPQLMTCASECIAPRGTRAPARCR